MVPVKGEHANSTGQGSLTNNYSCVPQREGTMAYVIARIYSGPGTSKVDENFRAHNPGYSRQSWRKALV